MRSEGHASIIDGQIKKLVNWSVNTGGISVFGKRTTLLISITDRDIVPINKFTKTWACLVWPLSRYWWKFEKLGECIFVNLKKFFKLSRMDIIMNQDLPGFGIYTSFSIPTWITTKLPSYTLVQWCTRLPIDLLIISLAVLNYVLKIEKFWHVINAFD